MRFTVREYLDEDGRSPFRDWLAGLDVPARARIQARVLRFETGNLGDNKSLGDGVWEARLVFGPGYRLYFAKVGQRVVLLLLGGDKSSQTKDIERAKRYWAHHTKEAKHGKAK
jgi:putative addiction module killer protein